MSADFEPTVIDLARESDFRLGEFLVRPSVRQVEGKSGSQTLEPRVMQVLVMLGRRPGEVISRDELIRACWGVRAIGEDAINRCISKVRKVDEAGASFAVETIPRVGYRMRVADTPDGARIASASAKAGPAGGLQSISTVPGPRRLIAAAAVAGVALLGAVAWWWTTFNGRTADVAPPSQRVAFFGFTAADDNPVSARIAADATDQTFSEFTRFHLNAAARADALAPYATDRLTRAGVLRAAYALSGEVRVEGEEARITIRLEDVATRATMWESTETSPNARPFYSPPKQTAFRAAGSIACIVTHRAEFSRENPAALPWITGYCAPPSGAPASTGMERQLLALRSLAKLEPRSVFFKTSVASQLVYIASFLPVDLQAERLDEADALLAEALKMAPGNSYPVAISEYARSVRGWSPLESEQLLATGRPGGSDWGDGALFRRRGMNLLSNGLTEEGVELLKASEARRPSSMQAAAFRAYGLASLGKKADAELLFEQIFASEPGANLVWPMWVRATLMEGVGDPEAILAAAPETEPRASVECWRSVLDAKRANKPAPSPDRLRECGSEAFVLAALGQVDDEVFDLFLASPRRRQDARMLFAPSARAIREHPRFLPLVQELGLWEYWMETESHPDVCDLPVEKDFEVCVELREAKDR